MGNETGTHDKLTELVELVKLADAVIEKQEAVRMVRENKVLGHLFSEAVSQSDIAKGFYMSARKKVTL